MSEEGYIKAPCQECHGRISLPADAVGVDFNCPHCGVGLQMLLKHTCEHCGGRLSFDGHPEAIGMQIDCSHCQHSTVLAPSTFAMNGGSAQPVQEEEQEQFDEEYEEEAEEEYEEEAEEIPEPETETRRRTGPPKPRPPQRGGPPKPRVPRKGKSGGARPGQKPDKISRSIAGTAEDVEEEDPVPRRKRPSPKRRQGPAAAPRQMAGATQQLDEDPADPMSGDLPGGTHPPSPSPLAPPGAGPMQRKVAGAVPMEDSPAGATPQPTFKTTVVEDDEPAEKDAEPWHKSREKKKLAIVGGLFLLTFLLVGLPGLGAYPSPFTVLFGDGYRTNRTEKIVFDEKSFKIEADREKKSVLYITGKVQNMADETFQQVELKFIMYDQQGSKLGETIDFTNELGPSMEWHFRAPCMFTNVARVDLGEVVVR